MGIDSQRNTTPRRSAATRCRPTHRGRTPTTPALQTVVRRGSNTNLSHQINDNSNTQTGGGNADQGNGTAQANGRILVQDTVRGNTTDTQSTRNLNSNRQRRR